MKILASILKYIPTLLLPHTCVLCNAKTSSLKDLCSPCQSELPWINACCKQCSRPVPITSALCGECLKRSPAFNQTFALFHYQSPLNKLIINLKFNNKLIYANLLGNLLAEKMQLHYQEKKPDLIIPVPLHVQRLRERGFNQALELAKPIAKKLKIPIDFKSVQRTRATAAQSLIPAEDRKKNVKNAFSLQANFSAKHILIIDDVMTTGHTINELSIALRRAGVARIDVGCCARTSGN